MNYGNVPLVKREDNLRYAGLESEVQNVRYYGSVRRPKLHKDFSKKIVAASLSMVIAISGFGITKYMSDIKQETKSEIVYVADVPDAFDGSLNMKVIVQADGEAFIEDENGNRAKKLNDIHAETIAEMTGYQGELSDSRGVIK